MVVCNTNCLEGLVRNSYEANKGEKKDQIQAIVVLSYEWLA